MDELDQALREIAAIRGHMARATEFRGYGAAALAATGALAAAAAWLQPCWVPHPVRTPGRYVGLWSAVAALAAALIAAEAVARARRVHQGLANEMIQAALGQFLPAAVAGLLLTAVLLRRDAGSASLLPGLWQLIFSLGVFATCPTLPRPVLAVGIWYLATGLYCLAAAPRALAPGMMGIPFCIGQVLAAAILWRTSRAEPPPELRDES
ncbi:MAG TPA: hypothetical protein VMV31_08400 [Terriglobales bacterium]|nr:hypothetical protein [Terriglobales bacterium]